MAQSAKVIISEVDKSTIVSSMDGTYAGIVITSDKGPVNKPQLVTDRNKLIDLYGIPNPKLGTSMYSALTYLNNGNKLWTVRACHEDCKYAGVLVRSKIKPIPTEPVASLPEECLIVSPVINGLTQEELDSYQFNSYKTNKLFSDTELELFNNVVSTGTGSTKIRLNGDLSTIKLDDEVAFTTKDLDTLNNPDDEVGESEPTYKIISIDEEELNYENLILSSSVTVNENDIIYRLERNPLNDNTYKKVLYTKNPRVVRSVVGSTNVLITNSDYISHNDKIVIGGTPQSEFIDLSEIDGVQATVNTKDNYTETGKFITIDNDITVSASGTKIFKVIQSEFEERDAFLVTSVNQGEWGNKLSIAITPSKNYPEAFNIIVYFKGVQVESHEVTRNYQLDGFGRQLNIEQKINGSSSYIRVLNNQANINEDGTYPKPLFTDYSLWLRNPEDIFNNTKITITENLLKGHEEVKLSSVANLQLGDRIKFIIGEVKDGNSTKIIYSAEYKITKINNDVSSINIDRGITENSIPMKFINASGSSVTTSVAKFDATITDPSNGIINGIKYYPISRLDKIYYNYPYNASFIISGLLGKLVSPGANMTTGGTSGSGVTVGDLIIALNTLENSEKTPIRMIMDGGWTSPAFAVAINKLVETQSDCHGFISTSYDSENKADYMSSILEYKNDLGLDTNKMSLFAGWIQIFDEFNQMNVWVSPEAYACGAQSMVTRQVTAWQPAAGYTYGKINALDVKVKFNEGERDVLIENRINPIRSKEGSGLAIWGNETLLSRPSPLQLRSVNMLLIKIKSDIRPTLEGKLFELNNEDTWVATEGAIDAYMRDEIKSKGGVYDYQVKIKDIITSSDIDNRRMPIFLGLKPTQDINFIPVTLTIFNSGMDITI